MFTYFHNVNAYVEEKEAYKADRVKLTLAEDTFIVTAVPVDTDGTAIVGVNPLVNKTCADFKSGVAYYEEIANQLAQGDVIRNI